MTLDTKLKMHDVVGAVALVMVVSLSACSSKPSPWSQQSSPWASKPEAEIAQPIEEVPPMIEETQPMMDAAASRESMYAAEPIEPAGVPAMEEMPVDSGSMMMAEPEPVMEPMGMAGDIVSQPANYFAVQVCASSSMDKLLKFASRYQLPDQWTAKVNVNGKDWYVLLLGIYPTRAEASAALSEVRGQLDTRPWIRSVGSLQAAMVP
ncbi:MAG: hypothetical protein EP315_03560 [Gammaproteobacteria bacterium]|nr:MAG: hypothetical protein EP315_03560 [Gammaproteobacteria bacterium]